MVSSKMTPRIMLIAAGIGIAGVALWQLSASWISAWVGGGCKEQIVIVDRIEMTPRTKPEIAHLADLIMVVDVVSSERILEPPTGGNVPAGVGMVYTLANVRVDRVVKGGYAAGDTVVIRQEFDECTVNYDDGPVQLLDVGKRYFITAEPSGNPGAIEIYFLFPGDGTAFTEITSQAQEDALVAEYERLLAADDVGPYVGDGGSPAAARWARL